LSRYIIVNKRSNPVKELRENQIKEAALKLFSEKGFYGTTITQIAEAAGLGKGTIYWYWKSKEELAFSLVEDMLSNFLELIEAARDEGGGFEERFAELVKGVAELYVVEKEHCRLLWKFRADRHYIFDPDYTTKVTAYYLRMREAIADLIRQGVESGELREIDPQLAAFVLLGITEGLEIEWLENEDDFDLEKGLEMVFTNLFQGFKR
jgi:AcrR family transcriptional regulator